MLADSIPAVKRRRFAIADPMDVLFATEKLAAAKQNYGREIRVFETATPTISQTSKDVSNTEESDDLEFSTEDYYRILATKKEDKYLKTKKIRDAEIAASRSRITKAVVRVRFPDNHTLEATFHPSEKMQSLVDLLVKVVARPDLPLYIYTTPPKKQIKDLSQDLYSAGFVPGAIVYFSYDLPKGILMSCLDKISTWKDVDEERKEELWQYVLQHFVLDPKSRKQTLQSIGKKWKNFKHYLYESYIKSQKNDPDAKKELLKPPDKYPFLKKADWKLFVSQRTTKDWEEKSVKGKEVRARHVYNHRMSRKGYAGLLVEIV